MALRRCRKCDLPLRLSRGYAWPGNGTIFARHDPAMRMVIFESGFYPYIWSELEHRLDLSVANAMIRGQNAATWDYLEDNVLYGWRKYVLHRIPIGLVIQRIINELGIFGFGKLEMVEYRRGKLLVMKVTRPFDILSLAWGIKGLIEFVEGKSSELAWREEDGDYIISVVFRPKGGRAGGMDIEALRALRDAKRELSLAGKSLPPQGEKREYCPSCGVPGALAELEWREEDGAIYRHGSDDRFIFSSGHIFMGVIHDLEQKTGQDLKPLVLEITKNYHLRVLQDAPIHSRDGAYHSTAEFITAGGYGEVVNLSHGEGHLEMTIANPFHVPRLVGRVAGMFEYVEGQDADIKYHSPEPEILEIEIKTA